MKIKEVTNPEEQLGLLRVIIDNTWSAIKQQAAKAVKTKPKVVKAPKKPPYAPQPKPLPKPPQQLAQPKQVAPKPATVRTSDELKAFQDYLRGEKSKTALPSQNRNFPQEPPTL
jgi:hypothetical protein